MKGSLVDNLIWYKDSFSNLLVMKTAKGPVFVMIENGDHNHGAFKGFLKDSL